MGRHKATMSLFSSLQNNKVYKPKQIALRPYQKELLDRYGDSKNYLVVCWGRRLGR